MSFRIVISIATLRRKKEGKTLIHCNASLYIRGMIYNYKVELGCCDDYEIKIESEVDEQDISSMNEQELMENEKQIQKGSLPKMYKGYKLISRRVYIFDEKSKLYTEYNNTILVSLLIAACGHTKKKHQQEELERNIRRLVSSKDEECEYDEDYIPPKENIFSLLQRPDNTIECLLLLNRVLRLKTNSFDYPIKYEKEEMFSELVYELFDATKSSIIKKKKEKETKKDGIQIIIKNKDNLEVYLIPLSNIEFDFMELLEFSDNRSLAYIKHKCPTMRGLFSSTINESYIPKINITRIFLLEP